MVFGEVYCVIPASFHDKRPTPKRTVVHIAPSNQQRWSGDVNGKQFERVVGNSICHQVRRLVQSKFVPRATEWLIGSTLCKLTLFCLLRFV